jgi:protein-S-isoprenylcysteine O-methyltransferase Ste14
MMERSDAFHPRETLLCAAFSAFHPKARDRIIPSAEYCSPRGESAMSFLLEAGFWAAWLLLIVVWVVLARKTKRVARDTSSAMRRILSATIAVGYFLICDVGNLGPLNRALWSPSLIAAFVGLSLTWGSILFAIWARLTLGDNWSAKPMVKEKHELATSGPYALARHPIYTGMLLATVGTGAASGQWRDLAGVLLILLAFVLKIRQEEQLMMETFPDTYPEYRKRVKAILPGIV